MKSSNHFAEIYEFSDGKKILSEFSNIEIQIEPENIMDLKVALEKNLITLDEIINNMTFKSSANDGGSDLYEFNSKESDFSDIDFYLVKCHKLIENSEHYKENIIIGSSSNIIEKCDN